MKLCITGALGHIGSRFIRDLKPGEFSDVVLFDNLATQRYCSLFGLPEGVPFRFVEGDVCNADLGSLFAGMDAVIHLAAITNAAGSFDIQAQVEKVNYEGTERVARACAEAGCGMVFLSTTSVYGVQADVVDEACPIEHLKPQSPYAQSKIDAERLLSRLGESTGLRFVSCRLGTVYGVSPGMRFHTAVNRFAWQACMGQPLTVWRTALHQRRPYLDLGDAVSAIRYILRRGLFDRQVYNVLTDNLTVNDVIEELGKLVGDVRVELVDAQIMNQLSYTVSNERFRALGFDFTGSYRAALAQTVALLRNAGHA